MKIPRKSPKMMMTVRKIKNNKVEVKIKIYIIKLDAEGNKLRRFFD